MCQEGVLNMPMEFLGLQETGKITRGHPNLPGQLLCQS